MTLLVTLLVVCQYWCGFARNDVVNPNGQATVACEYLSGSLVSVRIPLERFQSLDLWSTYRALSCRTSIVLQF